MPSPFARTLRSLDRESAIPTMVWLGAALLLFVAWLAWFFGGRVPLYEVSDAARLEVRSEVHPVAAVVGGRVVRSALALDREVRAGEVLVELDGEAERLALEEGRARLEDLAAQLEAVRAELALEREGLVAQAAAREAGVREAQARAREAEERASLAADEARRLRQLGAAGGISEMDVERLESEARARREHAQALKLASARLERDARLVENDRRQRVAELERRIVELEGQQAVDRSRAERLGYLLEQRRIRAAVDGRVGEAASLEIGAVVQPGDKLGSIVPTGELRASAWFPASALGRIRSGQVSRIRLSGFPWTEYGTLEARVAEVAREPRDGRFRVDFQLRPDPASAIPVEHGLPGSVEVVVERVSPFVLVLRAAGRALAPRAEARTAGVRP